MFRRDFLTTLGAVAAASAAMPGPIPLGINTYCLRSLRWTDAQLLDYCAAQRLDAVFLQDSADPGRYEHALQALAARGLLFECRCTRRELAAGERDTCCLRDCRHHGRRDALPSGDGSDEAPDDMPVTD